MPTAYEFLIDTYETERLKNLWFCNILGIDVGAPPSTPIRILMPFSRPWRTGRCQPHSPAQVITP